MFRHMPGTCPCKECGAIKNAAAGTSPVSGSWHKYIAEVTADVQAMLDKIAQLQGKIDRSNSIPARALKRQFNGPMDTRPIIGKP